jgi:hypothetical protein
MRPATDRQWQDAADAAQLLMMIEVGRLHGLLTGGPEVDLQACFDILAEARTQGIFPSAPDAALARAAQAVVDKCSTKLGVLDSDQWLGPELHKLREALRPRGEEVLLAHREIS